MIDFYVTEQTVRFASPVIAANSLDYLEAEFHFSGDTWDGYSKWAHFRQGSTVYDICLVNDRIEAQMHLNLSLGQWQVYLTGTSGASRLTTVPVVLTVKESGLVDEPLHQIPQSVAEQLDAKASTALAKAQAVETAAANGEYDGADGQSFTIAGYYADAQALEDAVTEPAAGDVYGVGAQAPYDIYVWDALGGAWVNNGSIQGPPGEPGAAGTTFIPSVADNGNLSWTNNGELENPATVNIMGPQGQTGPAGADGASPYELATANGFTGTEATFNSALAAIAAHGAKHAPEGTDPLPGSSISSEMLQSGAVTAEKLAAGVAERPRLQFDNTVLSAADFTADSTYEGFPFRACAVLTGVLASMTPVVALGVAEAVSGNYAPVAECCEGGVYIYAAEPPESDILIPTIICWRDLGEAAEQGAPEQGTGLESLTNEEIESIISNFT